MPGLKRNAVHFIQWAYWRHVRRCVALLPPAVIPSLAAPLSRANAFLSPARRGILMAELSASDLLAGRGADAAIHEAFQSHLVSQLKMSYLANLGSHNIETLLPISGRANLDRALERGRGVILLNPHFGPFMMVMPALGHRGYKICQVALQGEPIIGRREGFGRRAYQAKFDAIERNMPIRFINAAESGMALREVVRSLERNEIVLFASTGRGGKSWHAVPFLGRPATFNLTPFRIAARTASTMLPVFVTNTGPFAELVVERPLGLETRNGPEKVLEEYAAVLASYVRRFPDHFAMFLHDMRRNAWWDDHPFFSDYPSSGNPAGGRKRRP